MKFCDRTKIFVESGSGGAGCVSFRREKNVPFGGPDGGNGGRGGDVILKASQKLGTLIDFHYRRHFRATSGKHGQGKLKTGISGKDLILTIPVGTEVWIEDQMVYDLIEDGQKVVFLRGGEGGRGNGTMATSTCRTPREAYPGKPKSFAWIELRLKLLADVGIIGLPNAGKSTLLRALTNSVSKVGDYPFTTLTPQLGMFITPSEHQVVLADLPGLIEGAHSGKGLGHQFLGHAERCCAFLHVVDGSSPTWLQDYQTIREELRAYNPKLLEKEEILVINKCDKIDVFALNQLFVPNTFIISALEHEGLEALKAFLCKNFAS